MQNKKPQQSALNFLLNSFKSKKIFTSSSNSTTATTSTSSKDSESQQSQPKQDEENEQQPTMVTYSKSTPKKKSTATTPSPSRSKSTTPKNNNKKSSSENATEKQTSTTNTSSQMVTEQKLILSYLALLLGLIAQDENARTLISKSDCCSLSDLCSTIDEFILFQLQTGLLSKEAFQGYTKVSNFLRQHIVL